MLIVERIHLVRMISEELEVHYRELEQMVGPEVVERAYRTVDDLLTGLE